MSAFLRSVARLLASRGFLLAMVGAWLTLYVTLAVWWGSAFARIVVWLGSSPFVQTAFIVLLLAGAANLLRAGRERWREGKLRFALWVVLPVGVWMVLAGYLLSGMTRQSTWVVVAEGHQVPVPWHDTTVHVSEIRSPFADRVVQSPEWDDLYAHSPRLVLDVGGEQLEVAPFPPTSYDGTTYNILDLGLLPGLHLTRGGRVLVDAWAPLRLLPPGNVDTLDPPHLPYRFQLSLLPDRGAFAEGGQKVYDFTRPTYRLVVDRGDKRVFDGEASGRVRFDGATMHLRPPALWAWLNMTRDLGRPFVWVGVFVALAGLPLTVLLLLIRLVRREPMIALDVDGS